jgi:hypothetical protein
MQRTALMTAVVFCAAAAGVSAQDMPPKENTGVKLRSDFDRPRSRDRWHAGSPVVKDAQGHCCSDGAIALHSHKDRPTVVHVLRAH